MAIKKLGVKAFAIIGLLLVILLVIHMLAGILLPYIPELIIIRVITTSAEGLIYFAISYLYFKRTSTLRGKMLIVGVALLGSVGTILCFCFLPAIVVLYYAFYMMFVIDAAALLFGLWIYARKSQRLDMLQDEHNSILEMVGLLTRFKTEELEAATRNFQAPIGEGGSGAAFKATMEDGSIVAVKRIKGQASGEEDFRTEITIIASLQHVNLVKLLGYCLSPRGDCYLIYPFFENGSLDAWLFKEDEKRARLTWMLRYRIAIDVAKALAYFHHECHHQILHLDIKPGNILLDSNFRALVSDFGISKSIGKDESSVMTKARGTIGYLPPEMLVPNAISIKSDVYSYGVVLLELVGGRRNFMSVVDIESQQRHNSYFPKIVKDKMREGKLMEVIDPSLELGDIREEEVTVLVRVAFWCIQENPELRPSTAEVVDMLEGCTLVPMPPESPMFVVNFLDVEAKAQNEEAALLSANTISISIQSGR